MHNNDAGDRPLTCASHWAAVKRLIKPLEAKRRRAGRRGLLLPPLVGLGGGLLTPLATRYLHITWERWFLCVIVFLAVQLLCSLAEIWWHHSRIMREIDAFARRWNLDTLDEGTTHDA